MVKSEKIENLSKAVIRFKNTVGKIKKDANNPFFKSSYASLSNILDAINEPLASNGLCFVQFPTGPYGLTTLLMHESGEYLEDTYDMRPAKDDPQGRGSCITYQRRYALASVLGLNIDDDDDGNAASVVYSSVNKSADKEVDNKPWLNLGTLQYKAVVDRLKESTTTIDEVKKHYKISKPVMQSLEESVSKKV